MKYILLILCLVIVAAHAQTGRRHPLKSSTEVSHWFARATIEPPCDYRSKKVNGKWVKSPCNNQRGNHLPRLRFSEELQKSAQAFVNTCPSSHSRVLPKYGENLYLSFKHDDDISDNELIWKAVLKWREGAASYDPETGRANGFGLYYKQLIATNNREVGCAIARRCQGQKTVVVCHYGERPSEGSQYPVLVFDDALQKTFQDQLVKGANMLRSKAVKKCKKYQKKKKSLKCNQLPKVNWSQPLQEKAQAWANSLTIKKTYENKSTQRIFRHPGKIYASAAYPALCSRRWIRSAQVLSKSTTQIGCGQKWYKGCTWVVCYFA